MTEKEYLKKLKENLSLLKREDCAAVLEYYKEMIEDRIEGGKTEEQAVSELELPEQVAKKAVEEYGVKQTAKRQKPNGGVIALLIIGSPLWLALVIAAFAIAFAVVAAVAGVLTAAVAAVLAITLGGAVSFGCGAVLAFGNLPFGLIMAGFGAAAAACGVLACVGLVKALPIVVIKIKGLFKRIKSAAAAQKVKQ